MKECLAAVDLNNFCDFVKLAPKEGVEDDAATDEDCASEEEVSRLTDGYSLAAIKVPFIYQPSSFLHPPMPL